MERETLVLPPELWDRSPGGGCTYFLDQTMAIRHSCSVRRGIARAAELKLFHCVLVSLDACMRLSHAPQIVPPNLIPVRPVTPAKRVFEQLAGCRPDRKAIYSKPGFSGGWDQFSG